MTAQPLWYEAGTGNLLAVGAGVPLGIECGLSMSDRVEITTRYAGAYLSATKADQGRILNQVVAATGVVARPRPAPLGRSG